MQDLTPMLFLKCRNVGTRELWSRLGVAERAPIRKVLNLTFLDLTRGGQSCGNVGGRLRKCLNARPDPAAPEFWMHRISMTFFSDYGVSEACCACG